MGGGDGKDVLALANVGDSRAYVFSDEQMVQVTDDHSLAEERMRQGEITEAEAAVHPQRHILTRALGVSSEVETDMWELHLRSGDRVLLCSDGLSNEVDLHEMSQVLGAVADPGEAAQRLVDVANANGGADNITVVIVDVQIGEDVNGSAAVVTPIGRATSQPTAAEPSGRRFRIRPAGQARAPGRRRRRRPTVRCGGRCGGGCCRRCGAPDDDRPPHPTAAGVGRPLRRHAGPRHAARLRRREA